MTVSLKTKKRSTTSSTSLFFILPACASKQKENKKRHKNKFNVDGTYHRGRNLNKQTDIDKIKKILKEEYPAVRLKFFKGRKMTVYSISTRSKKP